MPDAPAFTVACIVRNGAHTLPRLFDSLKEFQDRGGSIVICDTGSTDGSAELARSFGAEVTEVGERFMREIGAGLAKEINRQFVVHPDPPIVEPGSRLFDFAAARNFTAGLAREDWVCWADSDEAFVNLDIDKLNAIIADPGLDHCEYLFCYAWENPASDTNNPGRPAVEFIQSKMYRHRPTTRPDGTSTGYMKWNGIVHEVLAPVDVPSGVRSREFVDNSTLYLGHWQQTADHRSNYLSGLAVAVMEEWDKADAPRDRNLHYLSRELLYAGRYRSAIKLFKRHIAMNAWPAERAQSYAFLGDCYGQVGEPEKQMAAYHVAFHTDPSRRIGLLRTANFYRAEANWQAALCYAKAAMEIPWHGGFYAEEKREYEDLPHAIAYVSLGWLGRVEEAQQHLLKCLEFAPFHPDATRDAKYYYGYDPTQAPDGWMTPLELLWIFRTSQDKVRSLEVGSWKGRSTHAMCNGASKTGGVVWSVDHFQGSIQEHDLTHGADPDAVYASFCENSKHFSNLFVRRMDSLSAAAQFPTSFLDFCFIDASHDYDSLCADIHAWRPKVRGILAGHDFCGVWPQVRRAVIDTIGEPDGVAGSIWWKKVESPPVNPLLLYLADCVRKNLPVSFTKIGDGEQACLAGAQGENCDHHPYSAPLQWKLRMAFSHLEKMALDRRSGRTIVNLVPFADQPYFNCLLHRNDTNLDAVKAFWGAVRESEHKKVFVGPERLSQAARMLRAEHVIVPLVNAFAEYQSIRKRLMERIKPGVIFVFSAGPPAKCLIAELLAACPDVSCLDGGSCWDPLFVGQTRSEQLPTDLLQMEYREWLHE